VLDMYEVHAKVNLPAGGAEEESTAHAEMASRLKRVRSEEFKLMPFARDTVQVITTRMQAFIGSAGHFAEPRYS